MYGENLQGTEDARKSRTRIEVGTLVRLARMGVGNHDAVDSHVNRLVSPVRLARMGCISLADVRLR